MKRIVLFMLLAALLSGATIAQNVGDIKGRIFIDKTKESLPGAIVMVKFGSQIFANSTDGNGYFTLKAVPAGVYTLTVSSMSYHRQNVYPVNVTPDRISFIPDVYLLDSALNLAPTDISGTPLIDKEGPSKVPILPGMIDDMAGNRDLKKIIGSMIPGTYNTDDGQIFYRGSRDGDAVYIVDGVTMMDGKLNIPGGSIGSMTVYTGGTPARYGDFTGACIVIETKSYFSWLNEQQAMNSH
jgi:hypothetical protein